MATDPISDTQPEYVNESRFSHYRMQHAAHHHELDKTIKDYGLAFDTMRADIVALRAELKAVTDKLENVHYFEAVQLAQANAPAKARSKRAPKKQKQLTDLLKWSLNTIDADGLNAWASKFPEEDIQHVAKDFNELYAVWTGTEDAHCIVPNELATDSRFGQSLYEIVNEYWSFVQIAYNSQANVYIAYQV